MKLEQIQKMVHDVVSQGLTPRTLILTPADAKALNIPDWTRQLMGMKVVIASNFPNSHISHHIYDTVSFKQTDQRDLEEYQRIQEAKRNQ